MSYNLIDIAADALKGNLEYASPELQKARLDLCEACEHHGKLIKTCGVCHCYTPSKVKFGPSKCPLSKW